VFKIQWLLAKITNVKPGTQKSVLGLWIKFGGEAELPCPIVLFLLAPTLSLEVETIQLYRIGYQ
jgi:hypothetical protein